jgi:hypothetical protein
MKKDTKISPVEVKSSGTGKHESLTAFRKDYSKNVGESFLISVNTTKFFIILEAVISNISFTRFAYE